MIFIQGLHFGMIHKAIGESLLEAGSVVDVGEWQSLRDPDLPMTKTFEVEDVTFEWIRVPSDMVALQAYVKPNLPWAEDHFRERVSGQPLNPGEQYKNWPWYEQGVEEHKGGGLFSHTYMERYWPPPRMGVRYEMGNLHDLEGLLMGRPHTRQAYLPVWFPEDLVAAEVYGERVPCSLGYHFLMRDNKLKVVYYMRSCDFFRYFRDDVYMTIRLQQRVAGIMNVEMGSLVMHISSLHIFEAEIERLQREHG